MFVDFPAAFLLIVYVMLLQGGSYIIQLEHRNTEAKLACIFSVKIVEIFLLSTFYETVLLIMNNEKHCSNELVPFPFLVRIVSGTSATNRERI